MDSGSQNFVSKYSSEKNECQCLISPICEQIVILYNLTDYVRITNHFVLFLLLLIFFHASAGSQDVAANKKTIEEYGITHILNLASDEIENLFEDEYNYLSLSVPDRDSTTLDDFYEEAFDFIDEGRHQGNCFVHCNASKPGLNRSTSICIAYLMKKEEKRFDEAFADVKEARSFVRPSDSFTRQLKELDQKLFGENKKDDIEDAFTKKKRQEIEAEKAALQTGVKLKDRAKLFASPEVNESVSLRGCESPAPVQTPGTLKNKWNPPAPDPLEASRLAYATRRASNASTDSTGSKKLTSIIGLFNKPKEETTGNNFSISKNTAPVRKWKTVEPPPRPGTVQLKRNKSRKFYNDTVRKNKSKSNLKQAPTEINNNSSGVSNKNISSDPKVAVNNGTSNTKQQSQAPVTLKRQSSNTQSNGVTVAAAATPPPPPPSQPKFVPAPPPPPPAPLAPPVLKTQPPTPSTPSKATPWRKDSNESDTKSTCSNLSDSRSVSPCFSDSSRSSVSGKGKPSIELASTETPQYRTTISMSPARRGSKSPDDRVEQTPTPPPPPLNRMVFGKVKPPALKIVGSSLSTERSIPAPPPPPVRSCLAQPVKMPDPLVEEITKPQVQPKSASAKPQPKKNSRPVYESESDDSESDEDDLGDGFTQIYDHRRPSEMKGLNRSSTMEILNLIKSKTGSNLAKHANMDDIDEDDEIENLLAGLETEGIDNVDWGELGIDLGEVKNIVEKHEDDEDTPEYECQTEESEEVTAEEESEPEVSVSIKMVRPRGGRATMA